jgi:hypothetical protein
MNNEYYCILMRRNDERWTVLCYFNTRFQAEAVYKGMLSRYGRYNQSNLRVISRTEAKSEFGNDWEYTSAARRSKSRQERHYLQA